MVVSADSYAALDATAGSTDEIFCGTAVREHVIRSSSPARAATGTTSESCAGLSGGGLNDAVGGLAGVADAECWARLHEQLQDLHKNVQDFANRCCPPTIDLQQTCLPSENTSDFAVASSGVHAEGSVDFSTGSESRFVEMTTDALEPPHAAGQLPPQNAIQQPDLHPRLASATSLNASLSQRHSWAAHRPQQSNVCQPADTGSTVSTTSDADSKASCGRSSSGSTLNSQSRPAVAGPHNMMAHRQSCLALSGPSSSLVPGLLTPRQSTSASALIGVVQKSSARTVPQLGAPTAVPIWSAHASRASPLRPGRKSPPGAQSPTRARSPPMAQSPVKAQSTAPAPTLVPTMLARAASPPGPPLAIRAQSPPCRVVAAPQLQRQASRGQVSQLSAPIGLHVQWVPSPRCM